MLCEVNQSMWVVSEEEQGRAKHTSAPALSLWVTFILLHYTSFPVSTLAEHPFTCVCFRETFFHMFALIRHPLPMCLIKTSFDITSFPKKLEVSASCPCLVMTCSHIACAGSVYRHMVYKKAFTQEGNTEISY